MNKLKTTVKILLVILVLISMIVIGSAAAFFYENFERDLEEDKSNMGQFLSGSNKKEEEPNFTCLFMGKNQLLTDFIMLGQYNPNTREVSLLSIPRDTNVGNASPDGKINSVFANYGAGNKGAEKVVQEVEKITGVGINNYLIFDAAILRKVIDTLGGVTVDVKINMSYDDPYQDLYIHLNKGVQRLNGAQAEQFVRFRKNNDGTVGYANGDIGRIAAQQDFIRAVAKEILKTENIGKVNELVEIVLEGTKTDITMDTISEYLDDVVTFKLDRIRIDTLPGEGRYATSPYGYQLSYYFCDEAKSEALIEELFFTSQVLQTTSDETVANNEKLQEVSSSNAVLEDPKIRIEVLNANAKNSNMYDLVEKLNNNDCNVVRISNFPTTKVESSRIITYGKHTESDLEKVKELSGIKNVVNGSDESNVKFTIILGSNY